jgi:hypothetical protein
VTLPAFQQALCELIRSPEACLELRAGRDGLLERYDLSPRERARLLDIVRQRGMSTSCTLYRSNRVTPIYTLLHSTCLVLGDRLKETLDAYWAATDLRDLEFKHEIDRFARFLRDGPAAAAAADPLLEAVLAFELAVNELRFAPRRRILEDLRAAGGHTGEAARLRLHPLVRIARFDRDPELVLPALAAREVPRDLPAGEHYLLLSAVEDELAAQVLEGPSGALLWRLQRSGAVGVSPALQPFVDRGIAIPEA